MTTWHIRWHIAWHITICHRGVRMTYSYRGLICHVAYFKEMSENVTMTCDMTHECQHDTSDDMSDDGSGWQHPRMTHRMTVFSIRHCDDMYPLSPWHIPLRCVYMSCDMSCWIGICHWGLSCVYVILVCHGSGTVQIEVDIYHVICHADWIGICHWGLSCVCHSNMSWQL